MNLSIQNIILKAQKSRILRFATHIVFWLIVGSFYYLVFNFNSEFRTVSVIFSSGLLPVAVLVTYIFNYLLVPKFLWKKRYAKFFITSFLTLLIATWASFLIVFFALLYILETEASLDPAVLHPELQVISLNFIVFLAISIKQVKRAFFIQQEKNELEKTKLNTELKLKEAELKILKAQIHPHFLFNTLNNLYGLTLEKSEEAPGLVLRLSEILDYILYRCEEKTVLLSEEIDNLKNYIEIEKIRYSNKLLLETSFPENVSEFRIAPLILLPFVENAFKHGVSKFPGLAKVKIKMAMVDKNLIFGIVNSKNPATKNDANDTKGIGLNNVKKRLNFIYPEKYLLRINEDEHSFSVNLTIELEESHV